MSSLEFTIDEESPQVIQPKNNEAASTVITIRNASNNKTFLAEILSYD